MKTLMSPQISILLITITLLCRLTEQSLIAQGFWEPAKLPAYLSDRGEGSPTSMFGTYIRQRELIIYPFYEFYYTQKNGYTPADLGYHSDQEFLGKFTASEGLIFLGYGVTDRLVFEVEAAVISAKQHKASGDVSNMPSTYSESGLGDVQTQIDYYWLKESASRPGAFSYLEIVYPFNKDQKMVGTPDYELKLGAGLLRGFSWGTVTMRATLEYTLEDEEFAMGELAVEYIKRLSRTWRVYLGIEGSGNEWEFISEAQIHLKDWMFIKLNNAIGKHPDGIGWYPEVGVMFSIFKNQ